MVIRNIQQELNNFSSQFNLPKITVNQICVDRTLRLRRRNYGRLEHRYVALDVEWAHAMAPNAAINLYIGSNATFPLYDAVQKAVNDGVNSIISMRWGSPENSFGQSGVVAPVFGENYPWLDQVLQQAAAQGITAFASSGDWEADHESQGKHHHTAARLSFNRSVCDSGRRNFAVHNLTSGFTQFPYSNATGSDVKKQPGSGTKSQAEPPGWIQHIFWHSPVAVWDPASPAAPGAYPMWLGIPIPQTGVIVSVSNGPGAGFTYFVVGGTSVGSPSRAGSFALIDQKAGSRLGLVTPALYSIMNNPTEYSKAFHDVTVGNNNPDSAGVGWDPLTGIGSPNLGELANYLAPTGSLGVSLQNQLSVFLTQSYSYGSSVGFTQP